VNARGSGGLCTALGYACKSPILVESYGMNRVEPDHAYLVRTFVRATELANSGYPVGEVGD
jgi:hypothetical protein